MTRAMKKRAKVHLLPTDKTNSTVAYSSVTKVYVPTEKLRHLETESGIPLTSFWEYRNIYITTDDEIKEGDTWINLDTNTIHNGNLFELANRAPSCKKIIAATDPELTGITKEWEEFEGDWHKSNKLGLPQPSKSFVEKYCKVGGIDEVDIEYGLFHDGNFKDDDETHAFKAIRKPRVNSHNEITIHPII